MTHWTNVEKIFNQALQVDPSERDEFLRGACGEDHPLFQEVASLLMSEQDSETFLETPALEMVAREMAAELGTTLVGRRLGSFQLIRIVDSGGMAAVYEAEHGISGQKAAVKVLQLEPGDISQQSRVRRFLRECKTLAGLDHPHIVRVLEAGQTEDLLYLAMELVRGQPLSEAVQNLEFNEDRILEIAAQVASALGAAHDSGVLHRDVKPGNLLIDNRGQVRLIDFGLVKKTETPRGEPGLSVSTESLTATGISLGTIDYMSPEQALGAELDARSDIYSLGVVLFEMTTGTLPTEGLSLGEKITQVLRGSPVRPGVLRPGVSSRLEELILKCMQRDPADRFQSCCEILRFLEVPRRQSLLERLRARFRF